MILREVEFEDGPTRLLEIYRKPTQKKPPKNT